MVELNITVLAPNDIARRLELLDDKDGAVTVYPLVAKVPLVTVSVCVPVFNASAS